MKHAEEFIKHCQRVVSDYKAGKRHLVDSAAQINASPFKYPFDGPVHPMMNKVANLAFDISEDYRSEDENKADWMILTKTLNDYVVGNWEATCWVLSAVHGEYNSNKINHSYSVAVRRQNGETVIESANDELKGTVKRLIQKLNTEQTDEHYLQNLVIITPIEIGKYKLTSIEVKEYLA